jgi:tRNA-dihydrouridine synthase A
VTDNLIKTNALRFSIAPMMEWTDRHCRFFHRLLSRHVRLYTEMVTTGAVLHGDRARLLGFDAAEHPVAVQLGGSHPRDLAAAARICADYGYNEINLNVGCPSDRVQEGRFGACLMREPELVGECVAAMKAAIALPITVKCRIGVDDQDVETALHHMAEAVITAGGDALIVHARKAWLQGLSPKENRDIPPLDYDRVYRLKQAVLGLPIVINGGIQTMSAAQQHLQHVDGVMMGRTAYHEPDILLQVDPLLYDEPPPFKDAFAVLEAYEPYIAARLSEGVRLHQITRHVLGLFTGRRGARAFRRHLTVEAIKPQAGLEVLRDAVKHIHKGEAEP